MESSKAVAYTGAIPKLYETILGPVYFEPYAIETAKKVATLQPRQVLETACGTGRVTNQLQKQLAADTSITATDISPDMLGIAIEKLSTLRNVSFQIADALNLPFADNSFDVVVCQFGAMFFTDKKKGFSEASRVLKKNGKFIFVVWDKLSLKPESCCCCWKGSSDRIF
jgi:ubiquinone/menaquinone biosynthesis C-methylase UbiE